MAESLDKLEDVSSDACLPGSIDEPASLPSTQHAFAGALGADMVGDVGGSGGSLDEMEAMLRSSSAADRSKELILGPIGALLDIIAAQQARHEQKIEAMLAEFMYQERADLTKTGKRAKVQSFAPAGRKTLPPLDLPPAKRNPKVSFCAESKAPKDGRREVKPEEGAPDPSCKSSRRWSTAREYCKSSTPSDIPGYLTRGLTYLKEEACQPLEKKSQIRLASLFHTKVVDESELSNRYIHWAHKIAQNRKFDLTVAVLILLNAAVIGIQADWGMQHLGSETPVFFMVAEYFFTLIFTLELALHVADQGIGFFHLRTKMWNAFDLVVIFSAWSDPAVRLVTSGSQADVSSLTVLRVIRLVRVLRIVRVMRFCTELQTMVQGIIVSVRPLFWCIVLLLMVMFIFAICIVQMASQYIVDQPDVSSLERSHNMLKGHFGGILPTVLTLYATITGGIDWSEASDLLVEITPVLALVFSLYIAFAVLCVLNIVTGVFVENAMKISQADPNTMVMEELAAHERREQEMRTVFATAVEGSADLTYNQFMYFTQDSNVQAYFRKIGLHVDHQNGTTLFNLLDIDHDGVVSVDDFVAGCTEFTGSARQLDVAQIREDLCDLCVAVENLTELGVGGAESKGKAADRHPLWVKGATDRHTASGMSKPIVGM